MLLISPPGSRICEAYPALPRLGGALKTHKIPYMILDGNQEGILSLINSETRGIDTETKRAIKGKEQSLRLLRSPVGYTHFDTYKSHIKRLNRLLEKSIFNNGQAISLANYQDKDLSPLKSSDLKSSEENFRENPFYFWFRKRIPEIIGIFEGKYEKLKYIGISVTFLSQALTAFAIAGFIRNFRPDIKIIWGGGLITSWKGSPGINNLFPVSDTVVFGPGEKSILELYGVSDEKTFYTPDYGFIENSAYISPGFILAYNTSMGCPWKKCTFCPEKYENNPYISEKYIKVTDELKYLVKKYSPVLIHLTDSEISPAMLKALTEAPPGAPWYGFCRFTKLLANAQFCRALADSGCRMLSLGLESGNKNVLEAMNKGIDLDTVPVILKNLKTAGIGTYIYILFGTPAEEKKTAMETTNFIKKHADLIDFLNAAIFNMPVNSEEAYNLDISQFYEGDLSLYSEFKHPEGWGRREIREFLKNDFGSIPEIREILNRVPPVFDSSHAPFFHNSTITAR